MKKLTYPMGILVLTGLVLCGCHKAETPKAVETTGPAEEAVDAVTAATNADTENVPKLHKTLNTLDTLKEVKELNTLPGAKLEKVQLFHQAGKGTDNADSSAAPAGTMAQQENFEKSDANWSNIKVNVLNYPSSSDDNDKALIQKEIPKFLQSWNALRNQKNSAKLAKLYLEPAYIRGEELKDGKAVNAKLKASFEKHKDFSQVPGVQVTMEHLESSTTEPVEFWSVRFKETFVQDGKSTYTEIFMVLKRTMPDDDSSEWKIEVESDASTDVRMLIKLGLIKANPVRTCMDFSEKMMLETSMLRRIMHQEYTLATKERKAGDYYEVSLSCPPDGRLGVVVDENGNKPNSHLFNYVMLAEFPTSGDPDQAVKNGEVYQAYQPSILGVFTVDFEKNIIRDEEAEIIHPIPDSYKNDIKKYCNI